jgi:hypothetical protein
MKAPQPPPERPIVTTTDEAKDAVDLLQRRLESLPDKAKAPRPIQADAWCFDEPGAAYYRGTKIPVKGVQRRLLHRLANAHGAVSVGDLIKEAAGSDPSHPGILSSTLRCHLSHIRKLLRDHLPLPATYDPIPCVEPGEGGGYQLDLPK